MALVVRRALAVMFSLRFPVVSEEPVDCESVYRLCRHFLYPSVSLSGGPQLHRRSVGVGVRSEPLINTGILRAHGVCVAGALSRKLPTQPAASYDVGGSSARFNVSNVT